MTALRRITRTAGRFVSGSAVLLICGMPLAHAGLGEPVATVQQDGAALRAEGQTTTAMPGYDRHDLVTADGGSVHEYATQAGNGAGTVFAVTFAGPAMPDLKTVLGSHYDGYLAAAHARRGNHHVLSFVADDGMVVNIVKLQRGFEGRAHLPDQVPRGVLVEDLR